MDLRGHWSNPLTGVGVLRPSQTVVHPHYGEHSFKGLFSSHSKKSNLESESSSVTKWGVERVAWYPSECAVVQLASPDANFCRSAKGLAGQECCGMWSHRKEKRHSAQDGLHLYVSCPRSCANSPQYVVEMTRCSTLQRFSRS